jgi:fatty-acyl-CoA synthase
LPYSGAHWVDHVARHTYTIPDSVALRFQGESMTWAQLYRRVQRLAAALAGRGVGRGDRVAILMTNRPEFLEATLAANAIGAIAVPVNFRLVPAEAAYILQDSGAALIVTDSPVAPLAVAAAASLPQPPRIIAAGLAPAGGDAGVESYQAVLDGADAAPPEVEIDEGDVALIMYTSGTTGRPKGAMLTHLNLLMQSITTIRTGRIQGDGHVSLLNVPSARSARWASPSRPSPRGSSTSR